MGVINFYHLHKTFAQSVLLKSGGNSYFHGKFGYMVRYKQVYACLCRIIITGLVISQVWTAAIAREPDVDSLLKVLHSNQRDTFKIVAGKKIGQFYIDSDPPKALSYFFPALKLAREKGYFFQEGVILESIGVAYDYKDNLDSCLYYLGLSNQVFKVRQMTIDQSHVFNDIAAAWYLRGNYELALRNYFEALDFRKKANMPEFISQSLNNIGIVYRSRKDYANAIKYYKESLAIKEKLNDQPGIFSTMLNLGSLYQNRDVFDSAYYYGAKALEIATALKRDKDIAFAQVNVGTAMINLGKMEGEPYIRKAEQYALVNNDKTILVVAEEAYGDIAMSRNNFKKAAEYYEKGLEIARSVSRREQMKLFYRKLAQCHSKMGDGQGAYQFLKQSQALSDTLLNTENIRHMNELSVVYETTQKEKEIERLNAETRVKDAETQQRKTERNYFILASLLLLTLAVVAYRAFISNENKNKQLNAQNQVIEEALRDKEILLKEIHHRVKNNLQMVSSLLNLQTYFIKDEMALDAVKDSRNRVQSMALIHQNLYQEENLTGIDVADYINKLSDNLFQSYNLHGGRIKLIKDIQPLNLDIEVVMPLGLMLNELITNALKYAFPDHREGAIRITLKEEAGLLKLSVYDNGVGMPDHFPENDHKSFGFNMIRDFLRKLKGEMRVLSEDGTKIDIDIKNYKVALHE